MHYFIKKRGPLKFDEVILLIHHYSTIIISTKP